MGGALTIAGKFEWTGGHLQATSTTPESGATINGSIATLAGGELNNPESQTIKWVSGDFVGKGATFNNDGTFAIDLEESLTVREMAQEGETGSSFNDPGLITSNGTPVYMGWDTTYSGRLGSLPGILYCTFCVVTDPEAKPPTGDCGIGQSGSLTWLPKRGSATPPDIEPGPADWKCTLPE